MSPSVASSGSRGRPHPKAAVGARRLGPAVALHVYDVSGDDVVQQVNDMIRPLKTGMFHAGVEVMGKEWSFGYTDSGSGMTCCKPRGNLQHKYRETVDKGRTPLSEAQVTALLERMQKAWPGRQYDILTRNCCHFSDALCRELGVGPAPEWVTNMAGAGAMLRSGVSQAVSQAHAAAGAAAAHASDLDHRYQISSKVDDFSTREVSVDEEYLKTRARELWSQASMRISDAGTLAEKMISEAQKPISIDVSGVEQAAMSFWSWATGGAQTAEPATERTPPARASPRAQDTAARGSRRPPAPPAGAGGREEATHVPATSSRTPQKLPPSQPIASDDDQPPQAAPPKHDETMAAAKPAAEAAGLAAPEEQLRTAAQEAQKQAEFASSALDFGDVETATRCLRDALASLRAPAAEGASGAPRAQAATPPAPPAPGAQPARGIAYKTRASAQRCAERAASLLQSGDESASAAALQEALRLLEG